MNAPAWHERLIVKDAARLSDELNAAAAHAYAESVLKGMFLQAATGDIDAPAPFARRVIRRRPGESYFSPEPTSMRYQTVGEVLADSLDYTSGPQLSEAMGLICAAAKGEPVQEQAQALLERMASVWASMNAEDE